MVSVAEIFETMAWGPAPETAELAMAWLDQHDRAFGQFVGGYGIEIDSTTPDSPPDTVVVAQIPDLLGPGITAQMSYYETPGGAKVFAGGTLDFGGSALTAPVARMLENLWARLSRP